MARATSLGRRLLGTMGDARERIDPPPAMVAKHSGRHRGHGRPAKLSALNSTAGEIRFPAACGRDNERVSRI